MFCFEICTPEGSKGGNANFKTRHTESLTQEIHWDLLYNQETFIFEQEEISDDIAPLYEQLATIDERIRQLNETITDGFKYTLFALETLEETTLEEKEDGGGTSDFIVDNAENSTSFDNATRFFEGSHSFDQF